MQSVRIHEHGDPSVIRIDDIPVPEPGPGQVLVRVLGVSLNHLDLWVRRGMPGFPVAFPHILGCDGTGEVVDLGEGVDDLVVGTRVVLEPGYSSGESPHDRAGMDHLSDDYRLRGEHGDGYDAQFVAIERRFVFELPAGVDPVQGAAVPLVYVTAWGLLVCRAQLQGGETVLVLGGASGVGSACIQLARHLGARVLATAGSEAKRELSRELGAHEVVDHYREDWAAEVRRLTAGRGVDVVVEHVGPATWSSSVKALARNGRLVTCGGTTGPKVSLILPHLFIKNLSVLGSTMGPRNALPQIFDAVASGALKPVVDRVLPMGEARRAHELLEAGEISGKIVLVPGD